MKIRTNFVSNSSSQSYLIARNPGQPIRLMIELPVKEKYCGTIRTVEELDATFKEDYGDKLFYASLKSKKDRIYEKYKKYLDAIKAGKELVWISGSNEDGDALSAFIYYNGLANANLLDEIQIVDEVP